MEFQVKTSKNKAPGNLQWVLNVLFGIGALFIIYFVIDFESGDGIGAGGDNTGEPAYSMLFIGMAICLVAYALLYFTGLRFKEATLTIHDNQLIIKAHSGTSVACHITELQIEQPRYNTKHPELKLSFPAGYRYIRFQSAKEPLRFVEDVNQSLST